MKRIGTVEVLRVRNYPLDGDLAVAGDPFVKRTEVLVEPGVFPLYLDGADRFWVMKGHLNVGERADLRRVGDGMIMVMTSPDVPGPVELVFPSRRWGEQEFEEFLTEPACVEGDLEQRLRIRVWDEPEEPEAGVFTERAVRRLLDDLMHGDPDGVDAGLAELRRYEGR